MKARVRVARGRAPRLAVPIVLAIATVGPSAAGSAAISRAEEVPALYETLRSARLEPHGRLRQATISFDRFELEVPDAELYLLEPVAGQRTGALIRGKGRVRMEPPTEIERQQLDKYLDDPFLDLEFKSVVLRFTDDMATRLAAAATPSPRLDLRRAQGLWRDRHEEALDKRLINLDARIFRDLLDVEAGLDAPGGGYLFADFDAKGWFSVEIDPLRIEEVRVFKAFDLRRSWNNWALFHRLADYDVPADARRSALAGPLRVAESWSPRAAVPEVAVDLEIEGSGKASGISRVRVEALATMRAIELTISQLVDVEEIYWVSEPSTDPFGTVPLRDASGAAQATPPGPALAFVQEHVGRGISEDRWEPRITVALPRTVEAGERFALELRYHGDLVERLPNRDYFNRAFGGWYASHGDARRSAFHTTFRTPERLRVASGGTVESERIVDGRRIHKRRVVDPVNGMSYHVAEMDIDEYERDGAPPITVYSSRKSTGFAPGNRDKTLDDIIGSIAMYEDYYGERPFDALTVTETPSFGGVSFQSFVMLSFQTFGAMHTGEAELFRTHELAHQWWGNSVATEGYRDRWLSEGFAQFSAALYTLLSLEDEDEFNDMMEAWRKDILARGDIGQRFGMRHYGFAPEALRRSDGVESGPIWIGTRLSSDETPLDYRIHVYEKGAYVLHMLRMMLYDWETGDDDRFKQLMRSFHADHRGGTASTIDFLEAVEVAFGDDMLWFFDQWVFGSEVPTLREDLRARRGDGGWRLQGTIRQQDVETAFRLTLPVRVRYEDDTAEVLLVEIDSAETTVDLPLRAEPDDIEVNPLHALLATIR